ncbi:hypothetical protein [Mesorhizobium sp.]|uniref:hypothetical protein n=1 Tax=Mesorhizobium sp. TaxID=1871066 RepID=UPI000FE7A648|nr:hypothetical protein [Mesorhizobium sp.]RWO89546.1 MAG: hypothetical protein EOQ96_05140 [Mesorhizobium sp.]
MAKLHIFRPKQRETIVVNALHPVPLTPEQLTAFGFTGAGLIMFGGRTPAKQIGSAEVRPLLRYAD